MQRKKGKKRNESILGGMLSTRNKGRNSDEKNESRCSNGSTVVISEKESRCKGSDKRKRMGMRVRTARVVAYLGLVPPTHEWLSAVHCPPSVSFRRLSLFQPRKRKMPSHSTHKTCGSNIPFFRRTRRQKLDCMCCHTTCYPTTSNLYLNKHSTRGGLV